MKANHTQTSFIDISTDCPNSDTCPSPGNFGGAGGCKKDHASPEGKIVNLKHVEIFPACSHHKNNALCFSQKKHGLHQKRLESDRYFKKCGNCQTMWVHYSDFLSDPSLTLRGYQVPDEGSGAGMFLFDHSCKTSLSIPVREFNQLYAGPVLKEKAISTDACPEHCPQLHIAGKCHGTCQFAYVRKILQIIKSWPKKEQYLASLHR